MLAAAALRGKIVIELLKWLWPDSNKFQGPQTHALDSDEVCMPSQSIFGDACEAICLGKVIASVIGDPLSIKATRLCGHRTAHLDTGLQSC